MLDIKWGAPKRVQLGAKTQWRREWTIPKEMLNGFFEFWKRNRFKLLSEGFTVTKSEHSGKWYLYETKEHVELFKNFGAAADKKKKIAPDDNFVLPSYKIKNQHGLREWQIGAVERLVPALNHWKSAVDGSELGTGKSFSAMGTMRELDVPFAIVCPKPVISTWKKYINTFFPELKKNLQGIINYEMLIRGRKDSTIASFVLKRETKRKQFIWKLPNGSIIIWDEAHRLKNWKTKASKRCMDANKQGFRQLFLSATLASSPLELRTVGSCTKMFKGANGYYEWAYDHGVFKGNFGLEFNNDVESLKRIHHELFQKRGVRLLRDVIPGFPETEIIVNAYDMDEESTTKIRGIYDEMKKELKALENRQKGDGDSELTIRLRALQKTELLKVPLFEEMVRDAMDQGMSVAVFLNYSESIDALAKRLGTKCIFDGRNVSVREQNLEDFQKNREKVIVTNSAATREGINLGDEHGGHPRTTIISPHDSVHRIKQIFGRVHRENSKSKSIQIVVYIANTQEEDVVDNCGQKLANLTLINNGMITDNDLKIK